MMTRIGVVAGEIWEYLEKHDNKAQLDTLIRDLDKDRDLVLMSIGWLSREGHITLVGECPDCIVNLVQ